MRRATVILTTFLFLATAMAGCLETFSSDSPPTVTMNVSPSGTVKVGDVVQFSATGSSDPDGDPLSFAWKFGDENVATGQTASHTYNTQGTFEAELCVSSTTFEICEKRDITVAAADAAEPTASIVYEPYKDSDCLGEEAPAGTFILAWICEEEMDTSEDSIDATTTIQLDGSDSSAGDAFTYITDYSWDLDNYIDSDGDGITDNDVDQTGENAEWTNVWPGEYEIKLTITDNQGFTDSTNMDVFVNYRGAWAEFTIDSNTSNNPGTVTFEFPVVYQKQHSSQTHSIRYVTIEAVYPQEDDEGTWGSFPPQNRLDLYAYNGSQSDSDVEEMINTTQYTDEDMNCGDEDRCTELTLRTTQFRNFNNGDFTMLWTVDLVNEKLYDTTVKSFVISLEYK
ncbi:MAG: PKD domain-containing protein [Candidatus Thermoplasmatota archaeon]|nr:PKD domain-containing protein [Candidatus Thermoplasmatota archaeon]